MRAYAGPIVTTIEPDHAFFPAEAVHHGYADRNPAQRYVQAVALPKLDKLDQHFSGLIRRTSR
jgi:peptide-methionine (S)-S-oxide reductase